MAHTLSEGVVVPDMDGGETISATGVAEMVALGVTTNAALATKAGTDYVDGIVAGGYDVAAIVYDAFDRTNGVLRTPTTGGDAWAAMTEGNTGIAVYLGTVKAISGSGNAYAWVRTGGDVIVSATITSVATDPIAGLVARYTSETDHLLVQLRASPTDPTYTVHERRSALYPLITTTRVPQIGDRFGIRVSGSQVQLVVNDEVLGTATHTRTGILSGVYFNGTDQTTAFDDFTVMGA